MYRDLECQHYLVQERYDQRPDIPNLTSVGFERWMTLLIQAHPEEKYRRLGKAVLEIPISNPDKRERLQKEISRRLFPQDEAREIREHVDHTIAKHADIQQSHHDTLFYTSSAGKRMCNPPQKYSQRRVRFVLPTDNHSDTSQHLEKPTYKCTEKARR
ncbi:hypothetical protein N7G274_000658 [Stereocaulon virgatum]|uniref:DUF7514 domain-containing protein n=1 Tax=Stereocaulon virgatum TaxID=373712 RepID=A0ABR4ARZ0_9LECA